MTERDWKNLALWLLDCEAATTQHLMSLKSASRSEVQRHRSICDSAVAMLESDGQLKPHSLQFRDEDQERVVGRAKSCLAARAEKEGKNR